MSTPVQDFDGFHSKAVRKETLQTLSLITPALRPGDRVLDVGCGSAYVDWKLSTSHSGEIHAVDIVDCRRKPVPNFATYDGITLPFEDNSFDVVIVSFVLHHVPNDIKPMALREVLRVTRRSAIILEDTPRNFIDRYYNRRHAEEFRQRINSDASYGFYTVREWKRLFGELGFGVERVKRIGRFAREWKEPWARSCFYLTKPPG